MIKKIIQIFMYIVFSILILFSIYSFVCVEILKKDYTKLGGYTYFVISTGSMIPEIEINDIVIVKINDSYKPGDVITYKEKSSYITHRVVTIDDDTIITKGDANNTVDDAIKSKQVLGKVVYHFSAITILKLFGLVLILFVLFSIVNFEKLFKKYVLKEENTDVLKIIDELMVVKNTKTKASTNSKTSAKTKSNISKKDKVKFSKSVLDLLAVDRENTELMNNETREKIKFVYRMALILKSKKEKEIIEVVENPNFEEVFDYEFEKVDFSKQFENQLYVMPITTYLKVLLVASVYNKDKFYDATYKVMKYNVLVDKNKTFITKYTKEELERIIKSIEDISALIKLDLEKEKKYLDAKIDLEK